MFINRLYGIFRTGGRKTAVLSDKRTQDEAIDLYETDEDLSHEITFCFYSLVRASIFLNFHISPGSSMSRRLVLAAPRYPNPAIFPDAVESFHESGA